MATPRARNTAVLEVVDVEVGHWCNDCHTPGGIRIWLVSTTAGRMVMADGFGCSDCGGTNVTPNHN